VISRAISGDLAAAAAKRRERDHRILFNRQQVQRACSQLEV